MTILFIGGEIEDFVTFGAVTMNSAASDIRNRGALWSRGYVECASGTALGSYLKASFAAQSTVWVTARVFYQSSFTVNYLPFCLANGSTNRIRLRVSTSAISSTIVLEKFDGSSATTLATSTNTLTGGTVYKLDVYCNYAVSGNIKVYFNQTLPLILNQILLVFQEFYVMNVIVLSNGKSGAKLVLFHYASNTMSRRD